MKDLTEGSPIKLLISLTLPMFISVLFQKFYNIADSIIAGRYAGEEALASIGVSEPVIHTFTAIAFGCNIGASIVISRLFGEKETGKMKCAVSTTIISSLAISMFLAILGTLFSTLILQGINTPLNIFDNGKLYLHIFMYGLPFIFIYNVVTGVFTALGDSKTPLIFLIISSLLNIILDYIFVAVFDFKVAGVAWATFIAQGLACILSLAKLFSIMKDVKISTENKAIYPAFSFSMFKEISKMAVPSILQQSFVAVGNIFIQGVVNSFGSAVIAGFSASSKLNSFAISSFSTLGSGLSAFASQNLGAGKVKRINQGKNICIIIGLILVIPFCLIFIFSSENIITFFMKNPTSEAIRTGTQMLHIVCPFYFIIVLKNVTDGAIRGVGSMKAFMFSTFLGLLIRVILVYTFTPIMGEVGIYWAWPIGWIIATSSALLLWRKSYNNINLSSNIKIH